MGSGTGSGGMRADMIICPGVFDLPVTYPEIVLSDIPENNPIAA